MKAVKLGVDLLVNDVNYVPGDVVTVSDVKAAQLIERGHAEEAGSAKAESGEHELADCIDPRPPAEYVVADPARNLAPNVADNPGLVKLAEAAPHAVQSTSPSNRKAAKGDLSPTDFTKPAGEDDRPKLKVDAPKDK